MKSFTITEFIRLIILSLLLLWGFFLLKPFIGIITWGVILGVALFPLFKKITASFGESYRKLATTLFTIVSIALLIVPTYVMLSSLFSNLSDTYTAIQNNRYY